MATASTARTQLSEGLDIAPAPFVAREQTPVIGSAANLTFRLFADRRVCVRSSGRIVILNLDEVELIEAERNYVRIHTSAESCRIRGLISGIEKQLDGSNFIRVHKSYIVNLNTVKSVERGAIGRFILTNSGKCIPIGKVFATRVHTLINASTLSRRPDRA